MAEEVITIDSDDEDDPAPGPSSSSMSYSPATYSNMIPVSLLLGNLGFVKAIEYETVKAMLLSSEWLKCCEPSPCNDRFT